MSERHARPDAEPTSLVRDRLGRHLDQVEEVIASLRQELERGRAEIRRLTEERDRLRRELLRADLSTRELGESEVRWRHSEREHQRETRLRQSLERHRQELGERCQELERELERGRSEQTELLLENQCLVEQIGELRAIVGLLAGGRRAEDG